MKWLKRGKQNIGALRRTLNASRAVVLWELSAIALCDLKIFSKSLVKRYTTLNSCRKVGRKKPKRGLIEVREDAANSTQLPTLNFSLKFQTPGSRLQNPAPFSNSSDWPFKRLQKPLEEAFFWWIPMIMMGLCRKDFVGLPTTHTSVKGRIYLGTNISLFRGV